MGIITDDDLLAVAEGLGYNLKLFKEYLAYQKGDGDERKWSVEAYKAAKPETDIADIDFLNWFSKWMGWGPTLDAIPDSCSFDTYCTLRDRDMFEGQTK